MYKKKSKQIRPKSKKNKKQHKKDIKDIKHIKNIKHKSIKTKKQPSKTKKSSIKTKSTPQIQTKDHVEAFTKVYENNIWGDNNDSNYEGSSGTGSDIKYNIKTYVPFLKHFIKKYKIKNVVDLGSGDFLVGLLIYDKMGVNYTGYDAYKTLVDFNNKKYEGYGDYKFIHSDFRALGERKKIVPAELCILKDVVQHWPTADIINFIDYLVESKKFKYILLINCFTGNPENNATHRTNIKPGEFSALSSKTYPLNKYNLEVIYTWDTKEVSLLSIKQFDDKKLSRYISSISQKRTKSIKNFNKTYFTARIILKHNIGRVEKDMNTLKTILEAIGGIVEVVYYDKMNNSKKQYISTNVTIQFFLEHTFIINSKVVFPADKSYIFINQENIQDWDLLNLQDKTVIPLCKSKFNQKQLQHIGINSAHYIGFGNDSSYIKEMNYNTITQIPNLCLHIAGSTLLKGTKQLIDIWISKRIKAPLIITAYNNNFSNDNLFSYWKTHNPVVKELPKEIVDFLDTKVKLPIFENYGSIYFCKDVLSDKVIKFLQHSADIHIYPSLIEEWGQIIDEARQSKACILTLDAPPMNELIDDKSGFLIEATKGDDLQEILPYNNIKYFAKNISYQTYKAKNQDLYNGIKELLSMSYEERRSLGEIAFHKSQIDYYTFKKNFNGLVQMDIMLIKKQLRDKARLSKLDSNKQKLIAPTPLMQNKCNNDVDVVIHKKNINKIEHICNTISINPTYLKKNEKQIIISEYEYIPINKNTGIDITRNINSDDEFADIFIREIFNVWLYTESYFPGNHKLTDKNNLIIVLKHFTNNEVNRLRLSIFKQLYKNVYIKSFNTNSDRRFIYKTVHLDNTSRFLHTENLMKTNYWITNRPGQNPYLKSLITIAKKSLGIFNINSANKIGFLYRPKYKCVYDIKRYKNEKNEQNDIKTEMDHVYYLLKDKLKGLSNGVDLSHYYEPYNINNKTIEDISRFIKDKKIIISVHCSDLINLCLLPYNATIIEITSSKHWYCDPVCKDHLSGNKKYNEDCNNRSYVINKDFSACGGIINNVSGVSGVSGTTTIKPIINEFYNVENSELYYNKAVYHNLALLCCKNWIEFQSDNGKNYKNNEIDEFYIDTDKLVEVIRDVYVK